MTQVSLKTESSMEKEHTSMRTKIHILDGGCLVKNMDKEPTLTMKLVLS